MDCVTVLLITYNQKKYIYQAIDSILMQNYENIQLIIADDSSPYFSVSDIEKYVKDNNKGNIKEHVVLKNVNNLGTVKNLNNARKYVIGKFVVIFSGDDLFYDENVISNYVKGFAENDDADVVVSQVLHYDNEMNTIMFKCLNNEQISLLIEGNNHKLYGKVCTECFIPAIGCAYSSKMLKKMGDFDERYYLVEDWPFLLKALRLGVRFCYCDFISAKHRDGGVSHNKKSKSEERKDIYHQDLIAIISNEVLPNYKFADKALQKRVYNYANDRVVISQFRTEFVCMTFTEKIKWILRNYNLPAIFVRGCLRKYQFKKNILS